MDAKPVEVSRTPRYPTRREMLAGAAAFLVANFVGNWRLFADTESEVVADIESGPTIVAPIFEHGTGRGATGCVVISPPVFLSEEEAMQIIREELSKHDVHLKDGVVLEGVRIPKRYLVPNREKDNSEHAGHSVVEAKKRAKVLQLNAVDSDKMIAVEFVSEWRYYDLGGVNANCSSSDLDDWDVSAIMDDENGPKPGRMWSVGSTVHRYDFKATAQFVATQVKQRGKTPIHLGVFYDPLREPDRVKEGETNEEIREKRSKELKKTWEQRSADRKQRKAEAKELLRSQARDFAAWLIEKKVISKEETVPNEGS